MRKILFFGFFFPLLVSATQYESDSIQCPQLKIDGSARAVTENFFHEKYPQECTEHKMSEILAGTAERDSAFLGEIRTFQTEVLDPLYRDHRSNPNFIAEHGIFELRRHYDCLQSICYEAFRQCSDSATPTNDQIQWCQRKVDQIFDIQKTKLYTVATQNQSRKERSLLRQKFTALGVRFRRYLHPRIADTVRQIHRFTSKVTVFIRDPKIQP